MLTILKEAGPQVVSREQLIDAVWAGNFLTGDKGLHQAIWQIRAALDDDARSPRWVATVPRVGYRWIAQPAAFLNQRRRRVQFGGLALAGLVAIGLMVGTQGGGDAQRLSPLVNASPDDLRGITAYRVNQDIHVEMSNGCRRILKDSQQRQISQPLLAADGLSVAFTATSGSECRLIAIELEDGRQHDYGQCPGPLI